MSIDLDGVYRRLDKVERWMHEISGQIKGLAEDVENVRQEVVDTRRDVLYAVENSRNDLMSALAALASAVADLRRYVEEQFDELRAVAEKYREEFLAEHEKRHRESVALSTYQQDFLKNLDIAMLGIKARIEEVSQLLKEVEDKTRRIDTKLFEYSLCLAAERVETM